MIEVNKNSVLNKKYASLKRFFPRIYLPRSLLKPIAISLSLNFSVDYHILNEIRKLEKQSIRMTSLEDKLGNL